MMNFGIYKNKRPMEYTDIDNLKSIIEKNKKYFSQNNMFLVQDKDERTIENIKNYPGISIPDFIKNVKDLLYYMDENLGKCERNQCNNKKLKCPDRWKLRKFCSRKCADLDYSEKQMGSLNTSHRMSNESRINMGLKISSKINKRILEGKFTPNITNSWAKSKVRVEINNEIKFVRSSWEAYFYILNPNLYYELIRIPYFDLKSKKYKNYITDFCDQEKKIIYEIKPKSKIPENKQKIDSAKEWCKNNSYTYNIITQEWIVSRYDKNILSSQPDGDRISYLIEKMIRYSK
jgi:hypothetical protein